MRELKYILKSLIFSSVVFAAVSCERIYEGGQDCSTKIKFEFRKHRQALQAINGNASDVFDSSVGTVHLFIYDEGTGALADERFVRTEDLKTESELGIGTGSAKCYLPVQLDPGKYRFVAWCGLGGDDRSNAFELTDGTRAGNYGECRVILSADGQPVHDGKYESLFHGAARNVTVTDGGGVVPVQLTKDTNDIAVMVQHLTAKLVPEDYDVVYSDANGSMKFDDNSVDGGRVLEYRQHTKSLLETSTEFNGELAETGALTAHISTARLMMSNMETAKLEVRNRAGETVFSIPFIKYLMQMQTFTSDGQYYLDCEDTYNCSFYLSGDYSRWTPTHIIINNWVKVPDQEGNI